MTVRITPHVAAIVLWYFGDSEIGYEPSGGIRKVLDAITGLDPDTAKRVFNADLPELYACRIAQSRIGGMDVLRNIIALDKPMAVIP